MQLAELRGRRNMRAKAKSGEVAARLEDEAGEELPWFLTQDEEPGAEPSTAVLLGAEEEAGPGAEAGPLEPHPEPAPSGAAGNVGYLPGSGSPWRACRIACVLTRVVSGPDLTLERFGRTRHSDIMNGMTY